MQKALAQVAGAFLFALPLWRRVREVNPLRLPDADDLHDLHAGKGRQTIKLYINPVKGAGMCNLNDMVALTPTLRGESAPSFHATAHRRRSKAVKTRIPLPPDENAPYGRGRSPEKSEGR